LRPPCMIRLDIYSPSRTFTVLARAGARSIDQSGSKSLRNKRSVNTVTTSAACLGAETSKASRQGWERAPATGSDHDWPPAIRIYTVPYSWAVKELLARWHDGACYMLAAACCSASKPDPSDLGGYQPKERAVDDPGSGAGA